MENEKTNEKRVVELVAPRRMKRKERWVSSGHVCGMCQGTGRVTAGRPEEDADLVACPMCGGSGKVNAVVTIEWQPINNKTEEVWI